nr:hypothetical protein [Pseudomonas sp. 8Z]
MSLRRLFSPRKPMRHFALLDATGRCSALRQCSRQPTDGRWVEVCETREAWLGAPLPACALLTHDASPVQATRALAA